MITNYKNSYQIQMSGNDSMTNNQGIDSEQDDQNKIKPINDPELFNQNSRYLLSTD